MAIPETSSFELFLYEHLSTELLSYLLSFIDVDALMILNGVSTITRAIVHQYCRQEWDIKNFLKSWFPNPRAFVDILTQIWRRGWWLTTTPVFSPRHLQEHQFWHLHACGWSHANSQMAYRGLRLSLLFPIIFSRKNRRIPRRPWSLQRWPLYVFPNWPIWKDSRVWLLQVSIWSCWHPHH